MTQINYVITFTRNHINNKGKSLDKCFCEVGASSREGLITELRNVRGGLENFGEVMPTSLFLERNNINEWKRVKWSDIVVTPTLTRR